MGHKVVAVGPGLAVFAAHSTIPIDVCNIDPDACFKPAPGWPLWVVGWVAVVVVLVIAWRRSTRRIERERAAFEQRTSHLSAVARRHLYVSERPGFASFVEQETYRAAVRGDLAGELISTACGSPESLAGALALAENGGNPHAADPVAAERLREAAAHLDEWRSARGLLPPA